jgi:ketosteroid isomerase-like protein
MNTTESDQILKDLKSVFDKMIAYSEEAQLDSFMSCYDDSATFLHIGPDGKMTNFEEFKKSCAEYYATLKQQKISTIKEKFNVIDSNLVISGWSGNIIAQFKNGDTMIMNNYSITNVFKKIKDRWKIIHSHESALPPEMFKNE